MFTVGSAFRVFLLAALAGLAGAYMNEHILSNRAGIGINVPPRPDAKPAATAPAQTASAAAPVNAPYLDVPAVVERPNSVFVKPYSAKRAGLKVKYAKNRFSSNQPELIYVPEIEAKTGRVLLRWQTSENGKPGLLGLFDGNIIEIVDDKLYDFGVGSLFVKVKREDGVEGYAQFETIFGETEVADDSMWDATELARVKAATTLTYEGIVLYEKFIAQGAPQVESQIKLLDDVAAYPTALSGGQPGGVHPLFGGATVYGLLMTALRPDIPDELRARAVAASEKFFTEYVFKAKVEISPGVISWPFRFDWTMNWGIKLPTPWYSGYANSQMIAASALLHRLTGKPEYRQLAIDATKMLDVSLEKGGAEYTIDGFRFPAEYVYNTPPMPNVRVIDGEYGTAIALYNAARLLDDSHMLRIAARHLVGLAANLPLFTQPDGSMMFSMYVENMPPHYQWMMWTLLQVSGNALKDRSFLEAAKRMKGSVPEQWCKSNGC